MENGELVRAAGLEFLAAQRDALDVKIFELRDVWWCKKRHLSTITGIENPDLFVWPPLPLPGPLPGVTTQVKDPFMIKDQWKAYVGTPTKTQRSDAVHSGMTPQLQR